VARRARAQRAIHVEIVLLGPRRFVETPAEIRDEAFEAFSVSGVENLVADFLGPIRGRRGGRELEGFA